TNLSSLSIHDALPIFPDWRAINAQALVVGRVLRVPDGRLAAEFRLWDVVSGRQLAAQRFAVAPGEWRRLGHLVADLVYERLTGVDRKEQTSELHSLTP